MSPADEPLNAELVDKPRPHPLRDVANNIWALYGLLFLVTGVLGVPLIFYNTKLGTFHKWFLTIAVTLYTCSLIGGVYLIILWSWSVIRESL